MAYVGYRPVLPGQNVNEWKHHATGEVGEYSNWQLQSSTQPLQDMPVRTRHEPTTVFLPINNPMELKKYSHGGQDAPYLRHDGLLFQGVPAAEVFHDDYGHHEEREFTFSRWTNYFSRGVPSAFELDGGHAKRGYGEAVPGQGPIDPYENQGVTGQALGDPGQDYEQGRYGFGKVRQNFPVPSAKAL